MQIQMERKDTAMAVSVYISNERLQVLVGSGSARGAKVSRVYSLALTEGSIINGVITNDAQLKEDMTSIWKQYRLPKSNIYLVIDSGKIVTKVIDVPYMKDSELVTYIGLEFADGERQEQIIDYFPFPKKGPYDLNQVFCAAVEKSVLESYLSLFEGMKLKVSRINIGLSCLIKTAIASKAFEGKTCIFQMLEGNNAISVLFENGVYTYSRRNRLFNDAKTPDRTEELMHIINGIQRFYAQKHSEQPLDTIYFAGFDEDERSQLSQRLEGIMGTGVIAGLNGIRFPAVGTSDNGQMQVEPASYIYCIGNLLN